MRRIRRALFAAAAATALALTAACEEDDIPPPPDPSPGGDDIIEPGTEEEDGNGGQNGAADVDPDSITPPGTELSVGDTAVVPLRDGVITVTVTGIDEGEQDLFQSEVSNSEGWISHYVRITAENVSDEDMSFVGLPRLRAVLPDGQQTPFSLIGGASLGDCEHNAFPTDAVAGTTIETCSLTAVHEDDEIAGAQWDDRDTDYHDDPIIWWL